VDDLKPSSGVGLEAEKLPLNFPNCRTPLYERGPAGARKYRCRAGEHRRRLGEAGDRALGRL